MNPSRRVITHSIKVASLCKLVLTIAFIAVAGLSYVYLKNQLHQFGERQTKLEAELAELQKNNEVVRTQIASLSSRPVIARKLARDNRGLVPITSDQVVRLNQKNSSVGDELRVVSNRGMQP